MRPLWQLAYRLFAGWAQQLSGKKYGKPSPMVLVVGNRRPLDPLFRLPHPVEQYGL